MFSAQLYNGWRQLWLCRWYWIVYFWPYWLFWGSKHWLNGAAFMCWPGFLSRHHPPLNTLCWHIAKMKCEIWSEQEACTEFANVQIVLLHFGGRPKYVKVTILDCEKWMFSLRHRSWIRPIILTCPNSWIWDSGTSLPHLISACKQTLLESKVIKSFWAGENFSEPAWNACMKRKKSRIPQVLLRVIHSNFTELAEGSMPRKLSNATFEGFRQTSTFRISLQLWSQLQHYFRKGTAWSDWSTVKICFIFIPHHFIPHL